MADVVSDSSSRSLLWTEWAASIVATLALLGLVLGMTAVFSLGRSLTVIAVLLLLALAAKRMSTGNASRGISLTPLPGELVSGLSLVGFGAWHAYYSGAEVFIRRDPASYANTAAWLLREGTLERFGGWSVLGQTGEIPFAASTAVYAMGDNVHQFQFVHGASVVMATMGGVHASLDRKSVV